MSVQERTCPACGAPAASDQRFCSACGTPLPPPAVVEPPAPEPEPEVEPEPIVIVGTTQAAAAAPPPPPPPRSPDGGDTGGGAPPPRQPAASPLLDAAPASIGFLASLFDLSFTAFVTPKIIRILYILSMLAIGIAYLGLVIAAFGSSTGFGLLVLVIVGPLVSLFWLAWARVLMEIAIVFFRVHESTADIAQIVRARASGPDV